MKLATILSFLVLVVVFTACRDATPTPPPILEATVQLVSSPTSNPEPATTPTPLPEPTSTPTPSPTPAPLYLEGWRTVPGSGALERDKPTLASTIIALAWVSDGISNAEREPVQLLVSTAMLDEQVFVAVVERPWVLDGLNRTEKNILQDLNRFSNEAIASLIPSMPFMETVEPSDSSTLSQLSSLDALEPRLLAAFADLQWVRDGIAGPEPRAIRLLRNFNDTNVALSVITLGWVQDGIDQGEIDAIEELSYIDYDSTELASTVVRLGWVRDGVDDLEFEALGWIGNFSNPDVASSVVALRWAQDGIEEIEVRTIEELSYIDYDSTELASTVVGLGWVRDGVTELEFEALEWVGNFSNPEVASSVVALQWVQDGIEEIEVRTIEELAYIDYDSRELASAVVRLGWVQDGIENGEVKAIDFMNRFPQQADALRIVSMPFLETLEPADVTAIKSLNNLALFRGRDFQRVLSHPTLSNGITDDWVKIVATLYGVSETNASLIDVLLDPNQVTLQERAIVLPLSGEVHLAIIRTDTGVERSMHLLEHAVRTIEAYMGAPLPTNYIGLLFEEASRVGYAGANYGTHVAVLPKYDVDDDSGEADFAGSIIAHEAAHYYWSGNADWIDEGAAELMALLSENARVGRPVEVTNYPCAYARTISELERLDPQQGSDEFICNYALGERLFMDLYRNLGADAFKQGMRNLFVLSQGEEIYEDWDDTKAGIEHVRAAFKDVESLDDQAVDMITARWYDGTEPYDTSARDAPQPNPHFLTVNGRIDVAYLTAGQDGPTMTSISANAAKDRVNIYLGFSYSVGSATEVPLEVVTYFEDGFVLDRRHVSFTAEPGFIGATWSLSVGQSPDNPWAPGQYRVYVYNEGRKLVELEYEVTE